MAWQLWVLVAETMVSALLAVAFIANGHYNTMRRAERVVYVVWDATLIPLLLTGADAFNLGLSWQHTLLLIAYTWTVFRGVQRLVSGEWKEIPTSKSAGPVIFCTVVSSLMIALIVTGAPQ